MYFRRFSCAVLLTVATAACGGRGPASPSAPSTLEAPSGATILGTVRSGAAILAASTGSAAAGITVSVVGTNLSTTVNGTGQFTITGVPTGASQLRFSGPGIDATLTLNPVQGSETIMISVNVSGNHAELESHEHQGEAELRGVISELSGSAASFQFRVGSRLVRGDGSTQLFGYRRTSITFGQLRNGDHVEVEGASRNEFVEARKIEVENADDDDDDDGDDHRGDDDDDDGDDDHDGDNDDGDKDDDDGDGEHRDGETEINGALGGLRGSCPSISFSLGSNNIATNGSTEFSGVSCSALKNGDSVKVEGMRQSSGVILAREVKRR